MGFSQNLAQLETSPYYKRRKLRLKEVSNLFIIVYLVHNGTLRMTPDWLTAGFRVLSHNCKHLHSTPHVPGVNKYSVFRTILWSTYYYILILHMRKLKHEKVKLPARIQAQARASRVCALNQPLHYPSSNNNNISRALTMRWAL